jgi:FtsH-binding integral membrane protein
MGCPNSCEEDTRRNLQVPSMHEIAQAEFDLTPIARVGAALGIAFLSAAEAAILSAPIAYYVAKGPRQVGEFEGIAVFGAMAVTAAAVVAIVFVGMFAFVVTRKKTAGWINPLGWTLCAALAAVMITLLIAHLQHGIPWAIGLNAIVLAVGLVKVFRGGAAVNSEN